MPIAKEFATIQRRLEALPRVMRREMYGPATLKGAQPVVEGARRTRAFQDRSGNLRRSIRRVPSGAEYEGQYVRDSAAKVLMSRAGYFIEVGAKGRTPKPFLVPALMSNADKVLRRATDSMKQDWDKVVNRVRASVK